jgi:PKD repeat protein
MKTTNLILITLLLLAGVGIVSAVTTPVISFTANVTEGTVQLPVKFTAALDPMGGRYTSYKWDFGDGSWATQTGTDGRIAIHTYQNPGHYTVTLEVQDAVMFPDWGTTLVKEDYIFVWHEPATPSFTPQTSGGVGAFPVTFTSTTTGFVNDYEWTIENVSSFQVYSGVGNSITYEFPQVPDETTYTVFMIANNEGGVHKPAAEGTVTVKPQPPTAAFSASSQIGVKPLYVQFNDLSAGSELSYNWDFGYAGTDNTSTNQNPSHTFTESGTYIVNLRVGSGNSPIGEFGYDDAEPLTIIVMNDATDVCPTPEPTPIPTPTPEPTICPNNTANNTIYVNSTAPKLDNIGVFRPSTGTWYLENSFTGVTYKKLRFGIADDIPLVGDFNSDGISDLTVFRPSTSNWYIDTNQNGATDIQRRFGIFGDVPVTGDYNADGKTDLAVYRPSTGTWYIDTNLNGATDISFRYGIENDIPVIGTWENPIL